MARKSSKSVKLSKKFEFNFEVVLIIVLIIVAIVLICFLNRKYRGVEGFKTDAELAAEAEAEAAAEAAAEAKAKKRIHFFFAEWCTHSTNYITDDLPALEKALGDAGLTVADVLIKYDVDADDGKTAATNAGVTKLPSFYTLTNGVDYDEDQPFKDKTVGKDLNDELVKWLND